MKSSGTTTNGSSVHLICADVRSIIRREYSLLDSKLPAYMELLSRNGADECWHKHGTFKEHLFGTWRILRLWGQSEAVCRLGLFHSIYSNDYVNLAIFNCNQERDYLKELLGVEAEDLVMKFCQVPRHEMIFTTLVGLRHIPVDGLKVKNIRDESELHVTQKEIAIFLIATMADWTEQWFAWQDIMTNNWDATMQLEKSDGNAHVLWPGQSGPGLYMSFVYRLGEILQASNVEGIAVPPIFNSLKGPFNEQNEVAALNLYNKVILNYTLPEFAEQAIESLRQATESNPFFPESHIYLAQLYLQRQEWELATQHARTGLRLLQEWGIASDKRVSWEAWIAWGRVLYQNSVEKKWPTVAIRGGKQSMIGLGLVY